MSTLSVSGQGQGNGQGHAGRHLHRYNPAAPSHRPSTLSELEVLQKNHRFIRDEDEDQVAARTWEEQLSLSWYNKLFREYALCDLTQYKSGGVALRWRTEQEVLDRIGELTCGALECRHHQPVYTPRDDDHDTESPLVPRELTPYQLNFRYEEGGQVKQALVKVVLCSRCSRKLTWKKDREKEKLRERQEDRSTTDNAESVSKAMHTAETALDEERASARGRTDRELRPALERRDDDRRSRSPESSKTRKRELGMHAKYS